ncbi:MAG: hypothetical protein ACR2FF_03385 [Mycobacteriales bacterium]|nr:MAG: hypothetical protein DLM56_02305 [Pseudonocardiales bacterium]
MDASSDRDAAIQIRCPATNHHTPIVRAVAAAIALGADFDIDALADTRLAVDEACSTLIRRAAREATMIATFRPDGARVRVRIEVCPERDHPLDQETFGWQVLSALVRDVTTGVEDAGADHGASPGAGRTMFIQFTAVSDPAGQKIHVKPAV